MLLLFVRVLGRCVVCGVWCGDYGAWWVMLQPPPPPPSLEKAVEGASEVLHKAGGCYRYEQRGAFHRAGRLKQATCSAQLIGAGVVWSSELDGTLGECVSSFAGAGMAVDTALNGGPMYKRWY